MTRILVVEDEAVIALRLQQRLSAMGYDVVGISYSGEDGLEKARSLRPDLILMDIDLPGNLDGVDIANIVKSELGIPMIFLTAFTKDQISDRTSLAEPHGYIVKPIRDRELKTAVEIALSKTDEQNTP